MLGFWLQTRLRVRWRCCRHPRGTPVRVDVVRLGTRLCVPCYRDAGVGRRRHRKPCWWRDRWWRRWFAGRRALDGGRFSAGGVAGGDSRDKVRVFCATLQASICVRYRCWVPHRSPITLHLVAVGASHRFLSQRNGRVGGRGDVDVRGSRKGWVAPRGDPFDHFEHPCHLLASFHVVVRPSVSPPIPTPVGIARTQGRLTRLRVQHDHVVRVGPLVEARVRDVVVAHCRVVLLAAYNKGDAWMDGWTDGWTDGWMDGRVACIALGASPVRVNNRSTVIALSTNEPFEGMASGNANMTTRTGIACHPSSGLLLLRVDLPTMKGDVQATACTRCAARRNVDIASLRGADAGAEELALRELQELTRQRAGVPRLELLWVDRVERRSSAVEVAVGDVRRLGDGTGVFVDGVVRWHRMAGVHGVDVADVAGRDEVLVVVVERVHHCLKQQTSPSRMG